ncbi:fungal trichothecene efflux pump [Coniochaeta sp. 2T2.1]|nr:fungal trichothecene efflux pump [Coniochaeta sp. 2T2.1]
MKSEVDIIESAPIDLVAEDVKGRDFTISDAELPKGYFRSFNFIGSLIGIGASFGCGVAGFSLVAPVLGFVNADIGPDPNLNWVALAYLLTTSIGLIIVGRVTDIFGRRWWFVGGNAVATVGSVVCAVSPNIPCLIAGQTLIGVGASVQLSYAFAVSEIVPMEWRFLAQAYVFLWGIPSSGVAPSIAYAFVFNTKAGWRGIFYLLIGLNAATTVLFYLSYRPPSFSMKHGSTKKITFIKHFDYIGTLMGTLGLLLFLMGISWGGTTHPWKSAPTLCTIIIGFLLLVAFVLYEKYGNLKEPLLPLHLFKNRGWVVSVILWSLGAAVYYANAILWPSMVAALYSEGHSTAWAGWVSCIPGCGILAGEYVGAFFKRRTNIQLMIVFPIGCIFLAAMATSSPDTVLRSSIMIFLASFFIGWNELINSAVATISIDDQREIGTATGAGGSSRSLISTVCSTVFTTVLANRLAQTIPARVPPAVIEAGLPESSVPSFLAALTAGSFDAVAGVTPEIISIGKRAYKEANAAAFNTVFLTTIAFSAIGIILTFFAPNVDHLLTREVNIQLSSKTVAGTGGAKEADVEQVEMAESN